VKIDFIAVKIKFEFRLIDALEDLERLLTINIMVKQMIFNIVTPSPSYSLQNKYQLDSICNYKLQSKSNIEPF